MGKMAKKTTVFSRRSWNARIALLWARKGGSIRLLPSYIKSLGHVSSRDSICYHNEKEFSFNETPMMHRPASLRFHMPSLPCIKPQVDFDYEFDGECQESGLGYVQGRKSYLIEDVKGSGCDGGEKTNTDQIVPGEDEAVDVKAEEFIADFYKQMKMQRQLSYLQYEEMLNRGTN